MPVYFLSKSDDTFRNVETPDWDIHASQVFGLGGNDDVSAFGYGLVLEGGPGDDQVAASGHGNLLRGGPPATTRSRRTGGTPCWPEGLATTPC